MNKSRKITTTQISGEQSRRWFVGHVGQGGSFYPDRMVATKADGKKLIASGEIESTTAGGLTVVKMTLLLG